MLIFAQLVKNLGKHKIENIRTLQDLKC